MQRLQGIRKQSHEQNLLAVTANNLCDCILKFPDYNADLNKPMWRLRKDAARMLSEIKVATEFVPTPPTRDRSFADVRRIVREHNEPINTEDADDLCNICFSRPVIIIFGCGHTVCQDCESSVEKDECPFCRKPFRRSKKTLELLHSAAHSTLCTVCGLKPERGEMRGFNIGMEMNGVSVIGVCGRCVPTVTSIRQETHEPLFVGAQAR
jgi:hypothetical protein